MKLLPNSIHVRTTDWLYRRAANLETPFKKRVVALPLILTEMAITLLCATADTIKTFVQTIFYLLGFLLNLPRFPFCQVISEFKYTAIELLNTAVWTLRAPFVIVGFALVALADPEAIKNRAQFLGIDLDGDNSARNFDFHYFNFRNFYFH